MFIVKAIVWLFWLIAGKRAKAKWLLGKYIGKSRCYKCNNYRQYHILAYNGGGMLPLCEKCWASMDKKSKFFWCHKLVDQWERTTPRTGPHAPKESSDIHFKKLRKAIDKALELDDKAKYKVGDKVYSIPKSEWFLVSELLLGGDAVHYECFPLDGEGLKYAFKEDELTQINPMQ